MSNSAVVRAVRRRISFYLSSPVFNRYGRSLRDFLTITLLTIFTMIAFVFVILWVFEDSDMTGIGSCGSPDCVDQ
jgi:hypothetical protein